MYLSIYLLLSGIRYFWNLISRVPLRIKGWNFFWMKFKLLRSNVPKIMKKFHREVGLLNFWKSRKIGWELFLHIYWFWQSTFVKFCEYFQMEILGVVDYYFGLIKGIGALSGAGWGSPLWACQPTDRMYISFLQITCFSWCYISATTWPLGLKFFLWGRVGIKIIHANFQVPTPSGSMFSRHVKITILAFFLIFHTI